MKVCCIFSWFTRSGETKNESSLNATLNACFIASEEILCSVFRSQATDINDSASHGFQTGFSHQCRCNLWGFAWAKQTQECNSCREEKKNMNSIEKDFNMRFLRVWLDFLFVFFASTVWVIQNVHIKLSETILPYIWYIFKAKFFQRFWRCYETKKISFWWQSVIKREKPSKIPMLTRHSHTQREIPHKMRLNETHCKFRAKSVRPFDIIFVVGNIIILCFLAQLCGHCAHLLNKFAYEMPFKIYDANACKCIWQKPKICTDKEQGGSTKNLIYFICIL